MKWWRRSKLLYITGGSGFLGRHLTGTDAIRDWEVIAPGSQSVDICNREMIDDDIHEWRPHAVVHLAYRRDDRRNIVAGSTNVARAAAAVGARLIHMSSDAVFGGRQLAYTETDAATPVNDYGAWKAEAERAVAAAHPGALILRTSLLYGTTESAAIQTDVDMALSGRSSMRFFTDEYRCPAHAYDVALAISGLAQRRDISGVLHIGGPQVLSRADLARWFARWQGHDPAVVPTASLSSALTDQGQRRAGRIELDSSKAAAFGFACRPIEQVLHA